MTSECCNKAAVGKHSQDHYSQVRVRLGSSAARSPLSKYPEMFIQLRDIQPSNASEYQPHMYFMFFFSSYQPNAGYLCVHDCGRASSESGTTQPTPFTPKRGRIVAILAAITRCISFDLRRGSTPTIQSE